MNIKYVCYVTTLLNMPRKANCYIEFYTSIPLFSQTFNTNEINGKINWTSK